MNIRDGVGSPYEAFLGTVGRPPRSSSNCVQTARGARNCVPRLKRREEMTCHSANSAHSLGAPIFASTSLRAVRKCRDGSPTLRPTNPPPPAQPPASQHTTLICLTALAPRSFPAQRRMPSSLHMERDVATACNCAAAKLCRLCHCGRSRPGGLS